MSARIRIVLADEDEAVRRELRSRLEREQDLAIVGEAADGFDVGELVARRKPDVLLLNPAMAGLGGIHVLDRIAGHSRRTRAVVLLPAPDPAVQAEALRRGAAAVLTSTAAQSDLVRAIREAAGGRPEPASRTPAPAAGERGRKAHPPGREPPMALTRREQEVLRLTADGLSSSEIARHLFISPRTAETHRANVMRKLGVHSRTDLVRIAIERGMLPLRRKGAGSRTPRDDFGAEEEDAQQNS
jgi:DNA-binding NarL/FixJ family response regulator